MLCITIVAGLSRVPAQNCVAVPSLPEIIVDVGNKPHVILAVDVNGDNWLDLCVGHWDTGDISLALATGDGAYLPVYRVRNALGSLFVAADINLDGVVDLATVMPRVEIGSVSVLIGIGNGTFDASQNFCVGDGVGDLVAADIDADGVTDVATANVSSDDVSVLFGEPSILFHPEQRHKTGVGPRAVVAADLNSDGISDILTTNCTTRDFSALLGAGSRVFLSEYRFGPAPGDKLVASDFNGDGKVDIATGNQRAEGDFSGVSVFVGAGNLTFLLAERFGVGDYPVDIAAADLDADGLMDLATANYDSNSLSVLLGDPYERIFREARNIETRGESPISLVIADLSSDGLADIATCNWHSDNASVFINPLSLDCNGNGILDHCDVSSGRSADTNRTGIPDECEFFPFRRGDCNGDGNISGAVTDAVFLVRFLFNGGPTPPCIAACDSNGDGETVSLTDAVYVLRFNFLGEDPPPAPFSECGPGKSSDKLLTCLQGCDS